MAFALWLTGLPASGKSSVTSALVARLGRGQLPVEVLESDEVRRLLTPAPTYALAERDLFYRALAWCGARLVSHGVNVIFDATANRRAYRDLARSLIPVFVEVWVNCPLAVCQARDTKGTYRKGLDRASTTVPGLQDPYEPPESPELRIDSSASSPEQAAALIMDLLHTRGLVRGS
ncbi:MAG: adenylyl-sulfate kinase [Deltaproteobacteria bacterium]|nr:adenylyl-sulfate kinase [Deltaproteobacteria bacterium]